MSLETLSTLHPQGVDFALEVKEQFERIYEETDFVVVGTLGRTAVMGGEPNYWYRHDGQIRDIDVYDPQGLTDKSKAVELDLLPLPLDTVGLRWLDIIDDIAVLSFPRDRDIKVELPASIFTPVTNTLLGAPVRTFSADVMLGLNRAVPYDRIRQREWTQIFEKWVQSQDTHNPDTLAPFDFLAREITTSHPEYQRMLKLKDYCSYLPQSIQQLAKTAYNTGIFKNIFY